MHIKYCTLEQGTDRLETLLKYSSICLMCYDTSTLIHITHIYLLITDISASTWERLIDGLAYSTLHYR